MPRPTPEELRAVKRSHGKSGKSGTSGKAAAGITSVRKGLAIKDNMQETDLPTCLEARDFLPRPVLEAVMHR